MIVIDIESNVVIAVEGLDERRVLVFLDELLLTAEGVEEDEVEERIKDREGAEMDDGSDAGIVECSSKASEDVTVDSASSSLFGKDDSTVELRLVGAVEAEED